MDVCPTYLAAREPVVSSQGRRKTKLWLVGTSSYQTKIGPATHKNCHGTWIAQFQLIFCIVFSQKTPATRESAGAEFHREDAQHGPSVRVRRYTYPCGISCIAAQIAAPLAVPVSETEVQIDLFPGTPIDQACWPFAFGRRDFHSMDLGKSRHQAHAPFRSAGISILASHLPSGRLLRPFAAINSATSST